jgi:hypothetical protein
MTDPIGKLRRELVAAARREAARNRDPLAGSRRTRRFAGRGRKTLVLVLVLVAASGSAVAATQLFGPPVHPGPVVLGGPKPGSVVLTPLRVRDPAGGLPWGVRIYTPRRGAPGASGAVSCVQIGRVLDGRLGVIGEDGAFDNDGLFHVLPVEPLADCVHAATFIAFPRRYIAASAFTGADSCVLPTMRGGDNPTTQPPRAVAGERACAIADLRVVVYGVATLHATSVRLSSTSGVMTEHLVAADRGAFLFVLPAVGVDANPARLRITFVH